MRLAILAVLIGSSGVSLADDRALEAVVHASFDDMPMVERQIDIAQACGASGLANPDVTYCTTRNIIYLRIGAENAAYILAHAMGHAIQVQHGIADIALREIRKRPAEEVFLRGLVTRQVECLAGFYLARAGLPLPDLNTTFAAEPFTKSHWGRSPLRIGTQVSIGIPARQKWLNLGHRAQSLTSCRVGELGVDLLISAQND